jgi:hypothetical protein
MNSPQHYGVIQFRKLSLKFPMGPSCRILETSAPIVFVLRTTDAERRSPQRTGRRGFFQVSGAMGLAKLLRETFEGHL